MTIRVHNYLDGRCKACGVAKDPEATGPRWCSGRPTARTEMERLRAVADAARELVSWDWLRLLDQDDGNAADVCRDVERLEAALKSLDGDKR